MRQRLWVLCGLVVLGFVLRPAGADEPADAEARLLKDLKVLTGDELEGRGLTTKGLNLAAEHIARQFQKAGLQPGGPDGTYFQAFKLTTAAKAGKENHLVLRGPLGQAVTLEAGTHFGTVLQSASGKAEAPLVFAGYGITSDDPKYDDYAGLDVAGKVVVVLSGTPRRGSRYADGFVPAGENRTSPYGTLRAKVENAQKHKAAGVLVVADTQGGGGRGGRDGGGAGLPRSFYTLRDGDPFALPVAYLRRDWADRLLTSAGADLAQIEKDIDAGLKPRSLALPGWACRLQTDVAHTQVTVKNVIGVVEGGGPLAKETVVVGAHYDHVGMGSGNRFGGGGGNAVSGPGAPGGVGFPLSEMGVAAIHRGADDNASGTSALIELGRRFGGDKGRDGRRLVLIAFTAEESGLLGSAYYCRHPVFPLQDTAAMVNMDMVGRLQDNRLMVGGVGSAKHFLQLIDKLNEKHRFDLVKEPSGQGPSDHSSFYAQKVPVFKFFTGFHEQYHRPTDRVETLNVPGLKRVVDLVGDVAAELRTDPTRPEYVKTGGFNRTTTLWAVAPSTGFLPDYADTKEGVLLEGVIKNTVGAKAGLTKGDRIVAVAGKPVKDAAVLLALTRALRPGEAVDLSVERDGKPLTVKLQLARAPAGMADARFGFSADFTDLKDGVLLVEVPENSPAGKAGLRKGDRLVSVAGEAIPDRGTYFALMQVLQPGEKVALTVQRDGKPLQFEVEVAAGSRTPAAAGRFGAVPDFRDDKEGILVVSVRQESAADAAGLKAGDRVTAINGQPVKDVQAYTQALGGLRDGDKVELTVIRDGQTLKVQAVYK